jgi:endonuclease/exonuclease/phosphatase family metal-dependent hydrolase
VKVVHWNLHHGGVPVNATGGGENTGPCNPEAISKLLVSFTPDVVSLNEWEQNDSYGNMDQLEYHRSALQQAFQVPYFAAFCAMNGGPLNKGIGVGLISRYPVFTSERKALHGGRPALYASQPFGALYTTHPDPASAGARNTQLSQQLCWHKEHEDKLLVCGDFNAVPSSVEVAPWSVWYKDAWAEAKKLGTATSVTKDGITHGSHRIDYIWYRGLTLVSVDVPNISSDGGKTLLSDHYPVIATFK